MINLKLFVSIFSCCMRNIGLLWICFIIGTVSLYGQQKQTINDSVILNIEDYVQKLMDEGHIPGLSLVIVAGNEQIIKHFGYADLKTEKRVGDETLFELASCSKAFTALAVLRLVEEGIIDLDAPVSDYLPWFKTYYEEQAVPIKIRHLLRHTSGIPWETIARIPEGVERDALLKTVEAMAGITLEHKPGEEYLYATVNYDILALVIETVTDKSFERFLTSEVLDKLTLGSTSVGEPKVANDMATGHKIGFFAPRVYDAPRFRGNNAAGYVISNAADMAKWLQFQLGLHPEHELYKLAKATHQRDKTVPLHGSYSYGMGWDVSLDGEGELMHTGLNPNFTSYVAIRPDAQVGIAVLANSNSSYTNIIGANAMHILMGGEMIENIGVADENDRSYSTISIILALYILALALYLGYVIYAAFRQKRHFSALSRTSIYNFFFVLVISGLLLLGVYLLPSAIAGFTWTSIIVWSPASFSALVVLVLAAVAISYLSYLAVTIFAHPDKYFQKIPEILVMSIFAGVANMVVIVIITSSIGSDIPLKFLIFYYLMALILYLSSRRYVQVGLIKMTKSIIYDMRIKLFEKVFSTSFQNFEKISRGRIYTALNEDVNTIGESTDMLVRLITSIFTTIGAFVFLSTLSFWAAAVTFSLIVTLATLYYVVSGKTNVFFEEARTTRDAFMLLINGMIDGFKELSLQHQKKLEYRDEVEVVAEEFRAKTTTAEVKFANTFLIGESLLVILLGVVAFVVPEMFPGIREHTILSFVVILLYLIGPINQILGSVPGIMQLKVAWNRLKGFINHIPASIDLHEKRNQVLPSYCEIKIDDIKFKYEDSENQFSVGPIKLEIGHGEIIFIIGGNGSGKTTLAKLMLGLYNPDHGKIMVNGKPVTHDEIGEYFSTVLTGFHLFDKLYNVDLTGKDKLVKDYLQLLGLEHKVEIIGNKFSTTDLSGGQRKRLELLKCLLEDRPFFLFDEIAADQDPEFRKFFYRILLPQLKQKGKTIIAITHDDHYFDVADKVIKMDLGQAQSFQHYDSSHLISSLDVTRAN